MFDALRAEAEHVVKATVTSASELSAGELDAIALRKRFNREVDVTTAVDASLIGGAVIDARRGHRWFAEGQAGPSADRAR